MPVAGTRNDAGDGVGVGVVRGVGVGVGVIPGVGVGVGVILGVGVGVVPGVELLCWPKK